MDIRLSIARHHPPRHRPRTRFRHRKRGENNDLWRHSHQRRTGLQSALGPLAEPRRLLRYPSIGRQRSEEHTSELQSRQYLVCRLLLEKKKPCCTLSSPTCNYFSSLTFLQPSTLKLFPFLWPYIARSHVPSPVSPLSLLHTTHTNTTHY